MDLQDVLEFLPGLPIVSANPVTEPPAITIAASSSGIGGETSVFWTSPPPEAVAIQFEIRKKQ